MKKLTLSVLALTLTLSLSACGSSNEPTEATPTETPVATEAPAATDAPEVTDAPEATEAPAETEAPVESEVSGETLGNTLLGVFNTALAEDASLDAFALADKLCLDESVSLIGPAAMEVEPGFLMGFNNYEVTDFEQGVMFAPMIGSIPFVGYVFTLPEDADAEAFVTGLKDNADLRWNICVEADEMVAEANGNRVFFVMCPATLEE